MNATQKFYIGFAIALLLVIGASFSAGYQVGAAHVRGEMRAHRVAP